MNLILNAPINNLGYGITGYNITLELSKLGVVSLYPIGLPESMPDMKTISSAIDNQKLLLKAPSIKIWHQNDLQSRVGNPHIGFPIFELDRFNPLEIVSLQHCDHIFVCSHWAKDIVETHVKVSVSVIPLGVDTSIFKPEKSTRSPTIFFNCGKWEVRKGHDILVECFNSAFTKNDNVELWMMNFNPFPQVDNKYWENLYRNSPLGSKIRIIPRQTTQKDVYNIMRQSDCGIFPARAEGWNLELLEMMACGKHVITTNYSAHTEFCNNRNAHLINTDGLEPAYDGVWFNGFGNWAKIGDSQKEQIVQHLRDIHKRKQDNNLDQNHNGIETAQHLTWANTAMEIVNAIKNSGLN